MSNDICYCFFLFTIFYTNVSLSNYSENLISKQVSNVIHTVTPKHTRFKTFCHSQCKFTRSKTHDRLPYLSYGVGLVCGRSTWKVVTRHSRGQSPDFVGLRRNWRIRQETRSHYTRRCPKTSADHLSATVFQRCYRRDSFVSLWRQRTRAQL